VTSSRRFDDPGRMIRKFVKHMLRGNVRSALSLLDDKDQAGAPMHLDMSVDSTNPVLDELMKKHPEGRPAHPNALLTWSVVPDSHPVIFEALNGSLIRFAAFRTKGAAGPSGMDAFSWCRLCTSFQSASDNLCNGMALVAKCLCTSHVDHDGISALVPGRLIALNKCPGIRTIGVGEVMRRIISKAVLSVLKLDILQAAGSLLVRMQEVKQLFMLCD